MLRKCGMDNCNNLRKYQGMGLCEECKEKYAQGGVAEPEERHAQLCQCKECNSGAVMFIHESGEESLICYRCED